MLSFSQFTGTAWEYAHTDLLYAWKWMAGHNIYCRNTKTKKTEHYDRNERRRAQRFDCNQITLASKRLWCKLERKGTVLLVGTTMERSEGTKLWFLHHLGMRPTLIVVREVGYSTIIGLDSVRSH